MSYQKITGPLMEKKNDELGWHTGVPYSDIEKCRGGGRECLIRIISIVL